MSKWVEFKNKGSEPNRKTVRVEVLNKDTGDLLGRIAWLWNWRQYTFYPESLTVFNAECLDDISAEVKRMNQEHKEQLKGKKNKGANK